MDWQQAAALVIVGATAGIMLWVRFKPRKFSLEKDTHCGCGSGGKEGPKSSIVYRAKKGERPQVTIKMR